ncbi:MAG: D-glycerate dehydrogenase [Ferroplasma sp.]
MKKILVARQLPGDFLNNLDGFDIHFYDGKSDVHAWLINNIKDADGILITLNEKIDRAVIDASRKLKVISTFSVGYDHIDVDYAKSKGIEVTNTPEVLTDATADLIFGIMLAAARRIVEGNELIKNNEWKTGWNPYFMLGSEVHGKTIGILGMGRIGKAVLKRATGFGMKIIYYSRHKHDVDAEYVELDYLLENSDFIIVALDLNKETYHFINSDKLSKMKNTAFLVNGTRGKVVDQEALVIALKNKMIKGAALDVFESEPINASSAIASLDNVVFTPHLGSATLETRTKMAETAVTNLVNVLSGKPPLYKL